MKKILPFLIIFVLCYFAIRAFFVPGFFTMHDDEQIARLFDLNNSLLAGQMPPRWVSHLGFGLGYPLFNFYPPFVYYLGEIFYLIGFSLINATKIVMVLGFIFSAWFMYLWVKNRYGMIAGIIAATLYTYAPYHSVDVYVRGDLAEFFAFVWVPAIFWSLDLIARKKTLVSASIAGMCLAALVLTHNLIAMTIIPFILVYVLYLFYEQRKHIKQLFPLTFLAGLIGVGLSAYFWLPSLAEKKYTLVDQILTKELADYTIHFVYIRQLWNSPWGYGGSVAGPWDGLTFQIGKINIILALLSIVCMLIVFIRKKMKVSWVLPLISFLLLLFSLYMTTKYSNLIWSHIQPLWYLQFPWRFLIFSVAFSAFLAGFCMQVMEKFFPKWIVYIISLIIICFSTVLMANNMHPEKYLAVTDANYTTHDDIEWRVSNLSYEYLPKGIATKLSSEKTTVINITKSDIPQKPYTVLSGDMSIVVAENKPQQKQFIVTSSSGGILQINTVSFPGWQVIIDGQKILYSDKNRLKLITFPILSGQHMITVSFANTFPRTLGNTITFVTLLAAFACCILSFLSSRPRR